jgi:hypothetical protein
MVRATQYVTRMATPTALKLRMKASKPVRLQAKRLAFNVQAGALIFALVLVVLLTEAMKLIGQDKIAAFLPYVALGMPARYLRLSDVKTASPYFRLALGGSGLVTVALAWAMGWPATLLGLAFGAREWVAYFVLRWWPREPRIPKVTIDEPMSFGEVARYTVILGRRLLTYRLTKAALGVFGPIGNAAARTSRGLNWHARLEPYVPHHFGGFLAFGLFAIGAAAYLALGSGEPAAMIVAAGLLQVGGAASNVVIFWHWLPDRDVDIPLSYDDDEE